MNDELEKRLRLVAEEAERNEGEHLRDVVPTRPGRAKSQMISFRLSPEDYAEVERVAAIRNVPVSAVVRGWVLQGVADSVSPLSSTVERLRSDIERVHEMLR